MIDTTNDLRMYIASHLEPSTQSEYDATADDSFYIIKEYDQMAKDDEGEMVVCQGFVVTCKKFIDNLRNCLIAQPSGIWFHIDGTYK